jgi:hypothetical protein
MHLVKAKIQRCDLAPKIIENLGSAFKLQTPMYMFVQVETRIVSLMLSENEQELHVILFSSYMNFAQNSVREGFLRFGSAFFVFFVKNYSKGSLFEKNFKFFHFIGVPRLE